MAQTKSPSSDSFSLLHSSFLHRVACILFPWIVVVIPIPVVKLTHHASFHHHNYTSNLSRETRIGNYTTRTSLLSFSMWRADERFPYFLPSRQPKPNTGYQYAPKSDLLATLCFQILLLLCNNVMHTYVHLVHFTTYILYNMHTTCNSNAKRNSNMFRCVVKIVLLVGGETGELLDRWMDGWIDWICVWCEYIL